MGSRFFEDPDTHRLVGTSPAAIWHLRMCGLNADHLINERAKRANYVQQLKHKAIRVKRTLNEVGDLVSSFRTEVDLMIPEIPPPSAK